MKVAMDRTKTILGGWKSLAGLLTIFSLINVLMVVTAPPSFAKKNASKKLIALIKRGAWANMPPSISYKRDGNDKWETIQIDRKKHSVQIGDEEATEIIIVARLSGMVQYCELTKLKGKNYKALMYKTIKKKTLLYKDKKNIFQLELDRQFVDKMHLYTVYLWCDLTGVAEGEKKKCAPRKFQCTPDIKSQVKAQVTKYLRANPLPEKTAKRAK